jgi:predicted nucleic acid-binding protein
MARQILMTAVIDANITLALVIPLPYSDQAKEHIDRWQQDGIQLFAPALWGYEVASGLRKASKIGLLTSEQAAFAVDHLWSLGIEEVPASKEMHQQALLWADRLGQTAAYDAQYIVVAELLKMPFWTADERLVDNVRSTGVEWIHWIGETEKSSAK